MQHCIYLSSEPQSDAHSMTQTLNGKDPLSRLPQSTAAAVEAQARWVRWLDRTVTKQ